MTSDKFWVKDTDGHLKVGLTENYLQLLGIIWVFMPAPIGMKIEEGRPFANIESMRCLTSLMSPITGTLVGINEKALDNPNDITSDDYLAIFTK